MGLAKLAGYHWYEIKVSAVVFNSLTGYDKTFSRLGCGNS